MRVRPINPYIAGKVLHEDTSFYGRQDLLEWVQRELHNPNTNAIVLHGQRRIGKTSLLLKLQRNLSRQEFLPIYFDLQDQANRPLGQVLYDLADNVLDTLEADDLNIEQFDDRGITFRREFLPDLYKRIGEQRRPVFLFDEFDVLDVVSEIELPQNAAARSLFPFLRKLMNEDPKPIFVFVVGRRADDLRLDFTATFKASLVREIWVLDEESVKEVILQGEKNNSLHFTPGAVEHIYSLTSGHPFLTQLLCQRIWERAYTTLPSQTPQVGIKEIDDAIANTLEAGDHALVWLWNGLEPPEKIYAAALAEISSKDEPISKDRVIQVIANLATRLRTYEVGKAPDDLVNRRMLKKTAENEYKFAIELFRRWVNLRKPLSAVKDELDQLEPLAEQNFRVGMGYFRRNQNEYAIGNFRNALEINPHHFQALLNLGEALLRLNRTEEAVKELERAYERDRDDAKWPLVRALAAHASVLKANGDDQGALEALERLLTLSPNDQTAIELRINIWETRGKAALESNLLDTALDAFEKARNAEMVAEVTRLQRRAAIKQNRDEIQNLISVEEWDEVLKRVERYRVEYPEEENWEEIYNLASEQKTLARMYRQAIEALGTSQADKAIPLLAQIIGVQPEYKNAPKLVVQAITGRDYDDMQDEIQRKEERIQILKNDKNKLVANRVLYLPAIVLGLLIGWLVIGWWLWPVQWNGASPDQLSDEYKTEYLRLAIASYGVTLDGEQAASVYMSLGDDAKDILSEVESNPGYLEPQIISSFLAAVEPNIAQAESDSGQANNATRNLLIGLCGGVILLITLLFLYYLLRVRQASRSDTAYQPLTPSFTDFETYGYATPITQFISNYRIGDDLFDDSFSIDSASGEFLGECGFGISESIGIGTPKKVTAFDVWLFDKIDIRTVTTVFMSEYAYSDEVILHRLSAKGVPVMVKLNQETTLETETLKLVARVVDVEYSFGKEPNNSVFESLVVELAVWQKDTDNP